MVVYWRGKKKSRGSDCKVQSLHCAITITGGRQPARYWWCAHRLSDFSACWRCGWWWGLRVLGYSEALMRISERGCIRAAE